jgi:hypothetical protein
MHGPSSSPYTLTLLSQTTPATPQSLSFTGLIEGASHALTSAHWHAHISNAPLHRFFRCPHNIGFVRIASAKGGQSRSRADFFREEPTAGCCGVLICTHLARRPPLPSPPPSQPSSFPGNIARPQLFTLNHKRITHLRVPVLSAFYSSPSSHAMLHPARCRAKRLVSLVCCRRHVCGLTSSSSSRLSFSSLFWFALAISVQTIVKCLDTLCMWKHKAETFMAAMGEVKRCIS